MCDNRAIMILDLQNKECYNIVIKQIHWPMCLSGNKLNVKVVCGTLQNIFKERMEIMRKKFYKKVCACVMASIMVLGLTACSDKGGANTEQKDAEQKESGQTEGGQIETKEQDTKQATEEKQEAKSNGEKITITFQRQSAVKAGMQERINAYNASQDEIEVKLIATTDHVQNMQKLQLSTASGQAPNIVAVNYIDVENAAKLYDYLDFNELLPKYGDYTVGNWLGELPKYGNIDGRQISLPYFSNNLYLHYNKKLFRDAGLDPEKPPQTWEELKEYALQIKDKTGKVGFSWGQNDPYYEVNTWAYLNFVYQNKGVVWDDKVTECKLGNQEGKDALKYLMELLDDGASTMELPENGFESGSIGMILYGSWQLDPYTEALGDDYGSALMPIPDGGKKATMAGGEHLMILDSGDEKINDAAYKVFKWLVSPEEMAHVCKKEGAVPVTDFCRDSDAFNELKENASYQTSMDNVQYSVFYPAPASYAEMSTAIYNNLTKAYFKETSVDVAIDNMVKEVNDIIAKQNK